MWELIIELEENEDVYFCYVFETLTLLMKFLDYNDEFNSDHCKYHIEKVSKED